MSSDRMIQPEIEPKQPDDSHDGFSPPSSIYRSIRRRFPRREEPTNFLVYVSMAIYVLSMFAPVSLEGYAAYSPGGWWVYLWGAIFVWFVPMSLFEAFRDPQFPQRLMESYFIFTWFANVLLYIAWGVQNGLGRSDSIPLRISAVLLPLSALLLAGSGLFLPIRYSATIAWPSPAYWVWLSSMGVATLASLIQVFSFEVRPDSFDDNRS